MAQDEIVEEHDLYSLPLERFTQARNDLVERLRKEGRQDEARRIKALRKPSLPAWVVNQLARSESDSVTRLLLLRDEMASFAGVDDLRRLGAEKRDLLNSLLERARAVLEQSGHPAGASTIDAITKTLQAGASEDERVRIAQGTLDRPLAPSGFEGMGGFEVADTGDSPGPSPQPGRAARRKAEKLTKEAEAAAREAGRLEQQAEQTQRQADDLVARAKHARGQAEELRQRAEEAIDMARD